MCIEIADVNHSVSGIVHPPPLQGEEKNHAEGTTVDERVYRLPKMYTTAVPLRPIVASNTHSYDLAVDDRNPLTVYRKSISNG